MIATRDIAWAAGIWEGEGSVGSQKGVLRTVVDQKDRWILDRFVSLFGGKVMSYPTTGAGTGTMHRWGIYGGHGLGFMFTIYPLLSPRRQKQFLEALKGCWWTKPWEWQQ